MNSIERVRAAIELRQPDRVPVDLHNFQPAAKAMGISMAEVFQDGGLLAEAMLKAWKEFGYDMFPRPDQHIAAGIRRASRS